jgi:hypothetical protein
MSVRALASACKRPTGCCQGGDTTVAGAEQKVLDDYIDNMRGMRPYCLREQFEWVVAYVVRIVTRSQMTDIERRKEEHRRSGCPTGKSKNNDDGIY